MIKPCEVKIMMETTKIQFCLTIRKKKTSLIIVFFLNGIYWFVYFRIQFIASDTVPDF
jgi:hypothetical protein